eukprot:6182668-Amphidinium_carterae.2
MAFDGAPLADLLFAEFNDAEEVCNLVENEKDLGDLLQELGCDKQALEEGVSELWNWLMPVRSQKRRKLKTTPERLAEANLRGNPQSVVPPP